VRLAEGASAGRNSTNAHASRYVSINTLTFNVYLSNAFQHRLWQSNPIER
jgi:hypothetical protein